MNPITQKIYIEAEISISEHLADREQLLAVVSDRIDRPVEISYQNYKKFYTDCRESKWHFTVTVVDKRDRSEIIRIEQGNTTNQHYGLAVDLGSTTVVMEAVDLNTGKSLAKKSVVNGQIAFGTEILSRIFYTKGRPDHLEELQQSIVDTFCGLLKVMESETGIASENFSMMVVAGNTTMTHLLLGIDPWPIFEAPFIPFFNGMDFIAAVDLNIPINGVIYCIPSVANYLGGDILSGLLTTQMRESEAISLFIDIGTNGEMVLGSSDFMIAGAGAAGPALEGGVSQSGMRAEPGAIDHVDIVEGEVRYSVIGGEKPKGICGSGIVDLMSEMLLNGWIDFGGNFVEDATDKIIKIDKDYALVYADVEASANVGPLLFTQNDICQYLDTKAASYTMVTYLLEAAGIEMEAVDHLYIAGGFCEHIRLESAINIGLYPDISRDQVTVLGNSSLNGARALLLNRDLFDQVIDFEKNIFYLEFGSATDFLNRMFAARFLPHTDLKQYPTVVKRLRERGIMK
ncbi:MAG: ASKHA domain-containing protein [Eubacterium sp.]